MASNAATLEVIRKLGSALLATPILHIPVYHSLCAAVGMAHDKHQRSRLDQTPRIATPPAVAQQDKCGYLQTPCHAHYPPSLHAMNIHGVFAAREDLGTSRALRSGDGISAQHPDVYTSDILGW